MMGDCNKTKSICQENYYLLLLFKILSYQKYPSIGFNLSIAFLVPADHDETSTTVEKWNSRQFINQIGVKRESNIVD